jgi:flavin reductase (DIM6/NTAB) family NADH-FMN oxidoreductase RutF
MKKQPYPLSKVYGLLEPGPVVLLTTQRHGRMNVMVMSWHMMMEFQPPLVGCIISNRNFTFEILSETKQCGINIPTAKLAKKVVGCGNVSGRKLDKFKKFHLTTQATSEIEAPLIQECYANLEARVVDTSMVENYCMFVLEVVKAWIDPSLKWPRTLHHRGFGEFMLAGKRLKLPSKMK